MLLIIWADVCEKICRVYPRSQTLHLFTSGSADWQVSTVDLPLTSHVLFKPEMSILTQKHHPYTALRNTWVQKESISTLGRCLGSPYCCIGCCHIWLSVRAHKHTCPRYLSHHWQTHYHVCLADIPLQACTQSQTLLSRNTWCALRILHTVSQPCIAAFAHHACQPVNVRLSLLALLLALSQKRGQDEKFWH